jgi:hypothetical protein
MATERADIANNAGTKLGGFGDQSDGSGQITQAELTANTTGLAKAINSKYPVVRKRVIKQFAMLMTPFLETQKFADLGDDLIQDDVVIESLSVTAGIVTFTTAEAHDLSVSDTRFLSDLQGTLVTALNGTTKTVATVPSTTTFTLTGVTGTDDWDYTESSGFISKAPETGAWNFAFDLPSDYFVIVRQTDEVGSYKDGTRRKYQHQPILNRDGDGFLHLTNELTNLNRDSAYIEYCIDQDTFAMFSPEYEECISMLLASEIAPVVGKNTQFRLALLTEYKEVTVPECQAIIQGQSDNYSRDLPDYKGGRSNVLFNRTDTRNTPHGGYRAT